MRAAMQEFSKDAKDVSVNPASIVPDIAMQFSDFVRTLFDQSDHEIDSLTITAIQLLLQDHLIVSERQCQMYLAGGEHVNAGKDKDIV